jgi:hypothetical protein
VIGRLGRTLLVATTILLGAPTIAHADAAGPTDYRSSITSIEPPSDVIDVTIEGGDSFVRAAVDPGHELIVLGYADEPYLQISADGVVSHNVRSLATYYNEQRYGSDRIPDTVDDEAPPEWERIGTGGSWAWHDHRAHWMEREPPIGLEPGESLPAQAIPVLVDGEPVTIEVTTTLQPGPSMWPTAFGLLVGLQIVLLAAFAGPATTALAGLVLAAMALIVGVAEFRSLPGETGPMVTWWLLPAFALVCTVATVLVYGRSRLLQLGLVALAGAQLLVWAFTRRSGLDRAVLPTDLPFWVDRFVTASALAGGALLVVVTVRWLWRLPVSPTS